MKVLLSNIQRFSLQDGPGIRTTVFFKGCNLRCPWCSNPENILPYMEKYFDDVGEEKQFGFECSLGDLKEEILRDQVFYQGKGGVTYSGGEALLQVENFISLIKDLSQMKINQCVETSLMIPTKNLTMILPYMDEYIVDVKILNSDECKKIQGDLQIYLENLRILRAHKKEFTYRFPIVTGYTYTKQNIDALLELLKSYPPVKMEIFNIHNLAEKKYQMLGRRAFNNKELPDEILRNLQLKIENMGIEASIIKYA